MGGLVEKQISDAMSSLVDRNSTLAQEVIGRDHTVNYLDVAVDEASTKLLALHQPAGRDLRFIMTSVRISTDLERIGDIAQNICERAVELNQEAPLKPYVDLPRMSEWTRAMLRDSLDASYGKIRSWLYKSVAR
jgi:phosphate transport system protein